MSIFSQLGDRHPLGNPVAQVPLLITVTNVSTQLLPANEDRRFVFFNNTGNFNANIAVGQAAVLGAGGIIRKGEEKTLGLDSESVPESIFAIVAAGSTTIAILEFE